MSMTTTLRAKLEENPLRFDKVWDSHPRLNTILSVGAKDSISYIKLLMDLSDNFRSIYGGIYTGTLTDGEVFLINMASDNYSLAIIDNDHVCHVWTHDPVALDKVINLFREWTGLETIPLNLLNME